VDFLALILVIISAFIHAGWNLFSQQRQVSVGFFFIACLAAAVGLSPVLWIYRAALSTFPLVFWIMVAASGAFEGLYYIALCGTYRAGDLSATYPLLRAVPVVLVALFSLMVGGGNRPHGIGLVGVILVAFGCLLLPLASFRKPKLSVYLLPASLLAVTAGFATSGYSLADNRAMGMVADLPLAFLRINAGAVFFLALKTLSSSASLAVILLARPAERNLLRNDWRKIIPTGALTGLFIFGAYGLVLAAMALASNVSYVVAFRQLSIPLGAALGFVVNKERPIPTRLVGIGIISTGLFLVAFG
jgi:drug/metabolite transporter (DMT)-like permease